jgi:AbiV family abortive infection protein
MSQPNKRRINFDEKIVAAMAACVTHAHDLLNSARAVQTLGHPNIAYHLAALALEEIGRRELLGVQSVTSLATVPPAWPSKHTQDHVKKLFWCSFGAGFVAEQITAKALDQMSRLARTIHETRLLGLDVDHGDDGLSVPAEAINREEAEQLIELAAARLDMAESEKLREHIPQEEIDLQAWFLKAADDPERRRQIMSAASLAKLAELRDARAWVRWLKEQFETAEAEARTAADRELRRTRDLPEKGSKDKWKLRVRILCASHSIRPKVLTAWNAKSDWIKLVSSKKNELIIEFILRDNVPVEGLWFFGWGLARHFCCGAEHWNHGILVVAYARPDQPVLLKHRGS